MFTPFALDAERDLIRRAQAGDRQARDTIVGSHQKFVRHVLRRYRDSGIDPADLAQEGNLGLLRAIQDFDPGRGTKSNKGALLVVYEADLAAIAAELAAGQRDSLHR
jgi:DNA-directed RNA polymerase sigma subunit (sigma70/sigma32)